MSPWMALSFATPLLLFAALYAFITRHYGYWKSRGVPNMMPAFPFGNIGSVVCQKEAAIEFFRRLYAHFEGQRYAGYTAITDPILIIRDPELIRDVLVRNFSCYHDRGFWVDEDLDPLSGHLFNLPGDKWKNLRQKLSPTFTSGKMKFMFPLVLECGDNLQKKIIAQTECNELEVEVADLLARYTTDVIGSTAFGIDIDSLSNPNAEFRVIGRRVFAATLPNAVRNAMVFFAPGLISWFRMKTADPIAGDFFMKLVARTVAHRESQSLKRRDFLQLLIELKNQEVTGDAGEDTRRTAALTMGQLQAQAFVFFLGGFETSATTLTFCLYELARNLDVQDKLASELDTVLESCEGRFTYESLAEMKYMDQVIDESLRIYPPIPVLFRQCTKDYVIPCGDVGLQTRSSISDKQGKEGETVIEAGTKVIISITGIHLDPKHYPNPRRFDPERFSEKAKKERIPFTYLPFGAGPRICIGMRFANMQTKIGLASIISKFHVRLGSKTTQPLDLDRKSFIPAIMGGLWLKFYPRTNTGSV